jgi:phage repressor protein C with HTH and peptisase S24 domain
MFSVRTKLQELKKCSYILMGYPRLKHGDEFHVPVACSTEIDETGFARRLRVAIGNQSVLSFATKCGVSDNLIRKYLKGSLPGVDKLVTMAKTAGVTVEWLATGEGLIHKIAQPKEVKEAVQEMRGYIDGIIESADVCFTEDERIVERDELLENNALAYVEQLASLALNKQGFINRSEIGADFTMVPRYGVEASAGGGSIIERESEIGRIAFRNDWIKQKGFVAKDLVVIRITGDSMEPTIKDGALVLVDTRQENPKADGIYILQNDGHLQAKRIQIDFINTGVTILSDNPSYSPVPLDKNQVERLYIIGKVVWAGQEV